MPEIESYKFHDAPAPWARILFTLDTGAEGFAMLWPDSFDVLIDNHPYCDKVVSQTLEAEHRVVIEMLGHREALLTFVRSVYEHDVSSNG